jgi:hypothetical protein
LPGRYQRLILAFTFGKRLKPRQIAGEEGIIFHFPFSIFHWSLVIVQISFRGDSCYFVVRLLGEEVKNDPRNNTDGHEEEVNKSLDEK